ncbi:MAG TPA: hypothetical protein VJ327_03495 [Patescibacteria group bacterium]|nr:hypothetical protein [Patescibacteria group bacterium]
MNEEQRSMTDENADAWSMIAPVHQIQRLTDWANMLEARVKEFNPQYRAYPWGRNARPLQKTIDKRNNETR